MFKCALLIFVMVMAAFCTAQLNFSPGWGKRALNSPATENNCKASVDAIMMIYKLIQNEAQKLVECDKFGN